MRPGPTHKLDGINVLVIDDEMARTLCRVIESLGGQAFAATSCAATRELFPLEGIDVAVVDHLLTNGEGPDLIREMHAIRPRLPVVLVSGMIAPIPGYDELGCSYLMKPFEVDALATAIVEALERADTEPPGAPE